VGGRRSRAKAWPQDLSGFAKVCPAACPSPWEVAPIQPGRKRHDGARTAQPDIIAPVGAEIAPARIEPIDRAAIAHHHAIAVDRKHAVGGTVDEQQIILLVDSKPARVGDPPAEMALPGASWRRPEGPVELLGFSGRS
jgi:hypothetical protein